MILIRANREGGGWAFVLKVHTWNSSNQLVRRRKNFPNKNISSCDSYCFIIRNNDPKKEFKKNRNINRSLKGKKALKNAPPKTNKRNIKTSCTHPSKIWGDLKRIYDSTCRRLGPRSFIILFALLWSFSGSRLSPWDL